MQALQRMMLVEAMNPYQSANPYAAPQAPIASGGYGPGPYGQGPGSLMVQGNLLVAANGSTLPPVCLKCGAQPTVWRPVRYQYTPPWAFLFLGWIGILIFTKRSSFQVPLCEEHRSTWVLWNSIAGLSWLPGLALCVLGGVLSGVNDGLGAGIIGLGMLVFLVGLITTLVIRNYKIVMPRKIDAAQTWLRGVHPAVLQAVSAPQVPQGYGMPQQPYPAAYPGYPG